MKTLAEVQLGDIVEVFFPRGYGNHCARVVITKINKKTLKGHEIKGSYGGEGKPWSIHKESEHAGFSQFWTDMHNRRQSNV